MNKFPKVSSVEMFPVKMLLFVSCAGAALVMARIGWSKNINYLFLIWNLFLAWLPLMFAVRFQRQYYTTEIRGWRWYACGFLWLLFLPNAPYIFTDLVHLHNWFREHYWVDLSLILLFGMIGFLIGFLSLYMMQRVVTDRLGQMMGWLFVAVTTGLSSFGIYVGRFLRWNSWDIITNPLGLGRDLTDIAFHPRTNYMGVVFPVLFATFLFLGYLMLYALTHLHPAENREVGVDGVSAY